MPSSHPHRAGRVRKPDDKFRTPLKKAQAAVPDQEGALQCHSLYASYITQSRAEGAVVGVPCQPLPFRWASNFTPGGWWRLRPSQRVHSGEIWYRTWIA